MRLNENLIKYRHQNNFSQDALAKKMYVSRQTISNWETGKTYPDIQNIVLLAEVYHVTVDQLVSDDINLMQNKSSQHELKLLSFGLILSLILVYSAFIGIKWLPITTAAMMVATFTTIGVILAIALIRLNNRLQLQTLKQTVQFINGQSVEQIKKGTQRQKTKLMLAVIVGFPLGVILTYLIAVYILNWSL